VTGSTTGADARPHVVVVGGGFGGLAVARGLASSPVRVTLLDRKNHHLFQPLLYQVAMAGLSPADISAPIRAVLSAQENVQVLLAAVEGVDLAARRLTTDLGAVEYDYLILAAGACSTWFGHDDWARHAPGLKDLDDAIEIRHRVLAAFEAAEREPDPARRARHLTFVVIGGGPTGVELAGALAELARTVLARDFRRIDPASARVVLVDGGNRILQAFSEDLSAAAAAQLERLGVVVRTGLRVAAVDADGLTAGDERLEAGTILWAAGVVGSPLARTLGVPLDRAGRVCVLPDLSLPGHPEAFCIGDMAACLDDAGLPLPGLAPVAMQQGRFVAGVVRDALVGLPLSRPRFRYRDKGSMATIGRSAAVAQLGRLELTGFAAWFAWLAIHILFLIDFRNRAVVLFNWIWSYFTYKRGARLITGSGVPRAAERPPPWTERDDCANGAAP
jgi:NADH dehydrogenase